MWLMYMQAGAYAAIMFAVLGVPQVLSGYFDNRARRRDHLEMESSAERRHRELLEERREERRLEEERHRREEDRHRREEEWRHREEERRREEENRRYRDEEWRREEENRRREEEERRREEEERRHREENRRHREMIALIIQMNNRSNGNGEQGQSDVIRAMQETIDALESENERLRQRHGQNGGDGSTAE